jgi:CBS domain-containing protein
MEQPRVPTVREIMSRKLVTLRPEMAALDAAELLLKKGISGAPVVDDEGHLLGLLSEYDCLRATAAADYEMDAHDAIELVGDLMSTECLTVTPDTNLFTLAHEFVSRRVRRFPVVENGKLIGQVSRRDALRAAVKLRRLMASQPRYAESVHSRYPDYPAGRKPIRHYPRN